MRTEITVVKCDHSGDELIRYPARVLVREQDQIVIEAHFGLEPQSVGGLLLEPGDRFVETYYPDRWYNIHAVHAGDSDALKGWYCNVSFPPEIGPDLIRYRDLALDLVVMPDGGQEVLDADEFEALALNAAAREAALTALDELQARFRQQFQT